MFFVVFELLQFRYVKFISNCILHSMYSDNCCAVSPIMSMTIILFLIKMYADTADSLSVTATVPVVERFGWTMFSAMEQKQVSQIVNVRAGDITTVLTVKMSLSLVSQVLSLLPHVIRLELPLRFSYD